MRVFVFWWDCGPIRLIAEKCGNLSRHKITMKYLHNGASSCITYVTSLPSNRKYILIWTKTVLKCSNVIPRLFAHRVHVIPHTTVCSLRKLTTLRCLCVNLYLRDGRADGRTDGLILRCFKSRDPVLLTKAFCVFVLPLLEFSSVVWNPVLKQDITRIELVQRRFTKRLSGLRNFSYTRLSYLGLDSLQCRRTKAVL